LTFCSKIDDSGSGPVAFHQVKAELREHPVRSGTLRVRLAVQALQLKLLNERIAACLTSSVMVQRRLHLAERE
jgi:hypothetical protein